MIVSSTFNYRNLRSLIADQFSVVELGDDITPCLDQRTLVLVNHQSTADVPLLMTTFNTKQEVLPNIMWIMDKVFMYTNFGIVSIIHKDFFIGSVSLMGAISGVL
jgi:lysophosphatidylglycerol acyltransferase 1